MKITKRQLRKVIQEELENVIDEASGLDMLPDDFVRDLFKTARDHDQRLHDLENEMKLIVSQLKGDVRPKLK